MTFLWKIKPEAKTQNMSYTKKKLSMIRDTFRLVTRRTDIEKVLILRAKTIPLS